MQALHRSTIVIGAVMLVGAASPSGMYARHAQPIWNGWGGATEGHSRLLVSPDRASRVVASFSEVGEEFQVDLIVSGRIGTGKVALGPGVESELL